MKNNLKSREQWEDVWSQVKIPSIAKPTYDVFENLKCYLPQNKNACSFIEIGCAPGRWMAFFSKSFGYQVSGVEYAEDAAAATLKNLECQGISAEIMVEDFLSWNYDKRRYDVVFSAGFIEHFQDLGHTVETLCDLSNRYVVTMVPNLYGINGIIRKSFSAKNYQQHVPIDLDLLESLHKKCNFNTLFCGYVGGIQFVPPGDGSRFYIEYKRYARLIYVPVVGFNLLSKWLWSKLRKTPNSRLLSISLMYIGERVQ